MTTRTVTVIIDVSRPQDRAAWTTWLAEHGSHVTVGENQGCGCCVDIYEITGEEGRLAAIPPGILAYETAPGTEERLSEWRKHDALGSEISMGVTLFRAHNWIEAAKVLAARESELSRAQHMMLEIARRKAEEGRQA